MIELDHALFSGLIPLFHNVAHSRAIVFSVLEGNSPGRIWVNDVQQPTCAFMLPQDAFYYAAGDSNNQTFLQELEGLVFDELLPQAAEPEVVIFSFSPLWHQRLAQALETKGVITINRKMFIFNQTKYNAYQERRADIPSGFSLKGIDLPLMDRQPDFLPRFESTSQRFGVCLLEGKTPVCVCSAVFIGAGEAEVDIHTEKRYQGQGLATLTASAFIDECLRSRLTPAWSCWPEREASWKLALRLGFEEQPDVPAILWVDELLSQRLALRL